MLFIALFVIILEMCCSCNFGGKMVIVDNEHREAQKVIENFLNAVEKKDKEQIKTLFSENALKQAQYFDVSVDKLFDYCNGTVMHYDDGAGPFVETTKEEKWIYQVMESSFTVQMDTNEYRFALQFVTKGEPDDIGISSVYVIKTSEDLNLDYLYWGDGLFTPGIQVAIPNEI